MKLDIPILNSASCKAQFTFNTELCTLLYSVVNCDSLRLANEKCKEGLKKLHNRNKMIRLADSSPGGLGHGVMESLL